MQDGDTRSLPAFGEIEARLGYNPARYLDTPDRARSGDTSPLATAEAMIRGIDDLATVRAWRDVEVALGRGTDGTPRDKIVNLLDKRQAQLKDSEQSAEAPSDHELSTDDDETHAGAGEDEILDEPTETPTMTVTDETSVNAVLADGGTPTEETPTCSDCQTDLKREEIAGQVGFWCRQCRNFQQPAETEVPA